jgi:hypothetical protein
MRAKDAQAHFDISSFPLQSCFGFRASDFRPDKRCR